MHELKFFIKTQTYSDLTILVHQVFKLWSKWEFEKQGWIWGLLNYSSKCTVIIRFQDIIITWKPVKVNHVAGVLLNAELYRTDLWVSASTASKHSEWQRFLFSIPHHQKSEKIDTTTLLNWGYVGLNHLLRTFIQNHIWESKLHFSSEKRQKEKI